MSTKNRFKYSDRKGVEYVVVIGEKEAASGQLTLQNMHSGDKQQMTAAQIAEKLRSSV